MNKRSLAVSLLTVGLSAGVVATAVGPAAAQGAPVGGSGNVYFLSGALNSTGVAQETFSFGDRTDEVYFGDWYGTGVDLPMVRRGNVFFVPSQSNPNQTQSVFAYGDNGDTVVIGDWDGDGKDSIAVRRGNHYFVKNDNMKTGKADSDFFYGDAGDRILVGNWNGQTAAAKPGVDNNNDGDFDDKASPAYAADIKPANDLGYDANGNGNYTDAGDRAPGTGVDNNGDGDFTDPATPATAADVAPVPAKGDTIMIQRGNQFFVKNSITTGIADYTFFYGNAGDTVLVGDWATPAQAKTGSGQGQEAKPARSADGADQLAVRRGNVYYTSTELEAARSSKANPTAGRVFTFGDASDTVFVASLPSPAVDEFGAPATARDSRGNVQTDDSDTSIDESKTIFGDGLGVRR